MDDEGEAKRKGVWSGLTDEQRAKLELGNEAYRRLKRGESIERWSEVGIALVELQRAAMAYGRTNSTSNRAYREAWADLVKHVPDLRDIDAGARSHAVWMVNNWPVVKPWLDTLPVNVRLDLNHPRSVRRKYDTTHKPPAPDGEDGEEHPSARLKLQDQIVRLTEELDATRKIKTTGAMPPGMSAEDFAGLLVEQMAPATRRRFLAAVQKAVENEARQDRLEEGAKGKRKR
jgi:hypothetical protein